MNASTHAVAQAQDRRVPVDPESVVFLKSAYSGDTIRQLSSTSKYPNMWYIQLKVRAGVNRKFIHKMLKCLSTPGYYASQEQAESEVFHHRMII